MAEYYTKEEVNELLNEAKDEVLSEIEDVISVSNSDDPPAASDVNKLWIKILE